MVLPDVRRALGDEDLRPKRHLVDAGSIDAALLVSGLRDHDITLVGPAPADDRCQARTEGAFTVEQFVIDRGRRVATCPAGRTSESRVLDRNCNHDTVRIRFSFADCRPCPLKARCTRAERRVRAPRRRGEHEALGRSLLASKDPAFIEERKRRAGIEGTVSKAVRADGLRRSRPIGSAKIHLQRVLAAAAIDLGRIADRLAQDPLATTRQSHFSRAMKTAA